MPKLDRNLIGTVLEPSWRRSRRAKSASFARAIGATDPIHTDVEAARAAGYRSRRAADLSCSAWPSAIRNRPNALVKLGFDVAKLLHGEQHFEYHRPVCAGDTVTLNTRIEDIYEKKGGLLEFMVQKTDAVNQDGQLCATMTAVVVQRHG